MRALGLVVGLLTVSAGCFNPSVRECAVSCSASNPCPGGATCLLDGFCHGSASDSLCSVSDAGAIDGPPMDAPLACGNSLVEIAMGEECDDGNRISGDGCSVTCAEEMGFVCIEQPSQCRPNPTMEGDLVITEVMGNPAQVNDMVGEWFELHNPTLTDFDLRDMTVKDDGLETFTVLNSLVITAGDHLVLGRSDNMGVNGGLEVDFVYGGALQMSNGGNDAIEVRFGDQLIDRITFPPNTQGAARSLSGATYDHIANDLSANFCDAVDAYGDGDLGTPGAMNPGC